MKQQIDGKAYSALGKASLMYTCFDLSEQPFVAANKQLANSTAALQQVMAQACWLWLLLVASFLVHVV